MGVRRISDRAFDDACSTIVELLRSRGGTADVRVIIEELEAKNISRATAYRAIKRLLDIGAIKRVKRGVFQLAEGDYALLAEELSREFCFLIRCENPEKLRKDLIEGLGSELTRIEEMNNVFISTVLPSLESSLSDVLASLLSAVYKNKVVSAMMVAESLKLAVFRKLVNDGCNSIFVGLPKEYVTLIRRVAEMYVSGIEAVLKVTVDEVYPLLDKLREILTKHGFKDVIHLRSLYMDIPISIKEITTLSLTVISSELERLGAKNVGKCLTALFDIADGLARTGCRTLGGKEKEMLFRNCVALAKALS